MTVIKEHDFSMQWNLSTDGNLWIRKPESVNEVGCIHTCQGLEVDYVGVIIGSDIIVRNGEVIIQPDQRAKTDQSLKGYKKALKEKLEDATAKAEAIIKNTYRTLMTRGQKGCYIYCTDPETSAYFQGLSKSIVHDLEHESTDGVNSVEKSETSSRLELDHKENIKSEIKAIQGLVDKGSNQAAIDMAISAMNECSQRRDLAGIDYFSDVIKEITKKIRN